MASELKAFAKWTMYVLVAAVLDAVLRHLEITSVSAGWLNGAAFATTFSIGTYYGESKRGQ